MGLSLEQRSEGMLLGTAVGDLLGSPFEGYDITTDPRDSELFKGYENIDPNDPQMGWKPKAAEMINFIREQPDMLVTKYIGYLGTSFWKYGETTDDTAQSVALAASLIESQGFNPEDVADRFVRWYDGGLGRGCGGSTGLALQLLDPADTNPPLRWYEAGERAREMGKVMYKGRNHVNPYEVQSKPANGALMRTAPLGVWFRDEPQLRRQATSALTIITHAFQECIDTSLVQTDLVAYLANGVSKDEALAIVKEGYPDVVAEAADAIIQPTDELGHTGGAYTTLGVALEAFEQTDNYHDAIVSTINSSVLRKPWACDIDTYGAVAGALAGTYYGVENIPSEWYELQHPDGSRHDLQPHGATYIRKLGRLLAQASETTN